MCINKSLLEGSEIKDNAGVNSKLEAKIGGGYQSQSIGKYGPAA